MSNNPEVMTGGAESTVEAQNAAAERSAELAKNRSEKGAESSPEAQAEAAEKARAEANKEALMSKEHGGAEKRGGGEPSGSPRTVTKKRKDEAYAQTMSAIRSQMSTPARTFSKVIHNPVVEKTSEFVGKTIARPNAILSGSTAAFVVTVIVYLTARHYGYVLSGSEAILSFVVGWMLGTVFDYVRMMISGNTRSH